MANFSTSTGSVPAQNTPYPGPTAEELAHIPAALTLPRQWVLWRGADRLDQQTGEIRLNKIPIDPQTLRNADTTDPATWGTFAESVAALPVALEEWETDDPAGFRGGGLGFVFSDADPYCGVDFDHCVNPDTGEVAAWAQAHVDALASYTEVSPTETGLHVIVEGDLPPRGRKKGQVEMYTYARFFTMTGRSLAWTPPTVEPRQGALHAVWCGLFGPQAGDSVWTLDEHGTITNFDGNPWVITRLGADATGEPYAFFAETSAGVRLIQCEIARAPQGQPASSPTLDDTVILDKANKAKHGTEFAALWAGDTTVFGGDESRADMSLCVRLAFWTQDPVQIDRLFRQSGLMRPKWDEKRGDRTYGARTLAEALARQTEHYTPHAGMQLLVGAIRQAHQGSNGQALVWGTPGPQPHDPSACPELPDYARTQDDSAADASLFLDDYITLSTTWAPRAYAGFHEAVALFLLSTLAARRIKLVFGPRGVYTSLYIALAARTTVYTKSTTADIGLGLLDAAGLSWLLADDDSTPQAFLRSLSLYVPSNYADMPPEEQEHTRRQLAFTAQRGWFYEEWGGHLEAMMQKNGYMAGFRSILRRLDDHKARYASNTIARGREILHKPYVSLLANVTPSDLQPFVKARSPLWRDGYIARFAFVTPDQAQGSAAEFPEGSLSFPGYLVTTLQNWHKRLGVPVCLLTPKTDKKGQPTGTYTIDKDPLPEKVYTLSPEVRTAYYAYDRAMRDLTLQRKEEDLDGSYGRFPMKALRIAGLLASLHDDSGKYTVWPRQWWRGQQIVERWRRDLHRLRQQVEQSEIAPSVKRQLEEKLLRQVDRSGPQSIREFAIFQKTHSREEIESCVTALVTTGELAAYQTAQTTKYGR